MKVLHLTAMWPTSRRPYSGTFVVSLVKGLRREGGRHDVLVVPVDQSRWNYFLIVPRFRRKLREGCYDLIHAQYAHCALIAGLFSTVPVVAHYHGEFGYHFKGTEEKLVDALVRAAYWKDSSIAHFSSRLVKGAIVVNPADLKFVASPHKAVISIGTDEEVFMPMPREEACARLGWEPAPARVLFPSSPKRPEKNYPLFQKVIRLLREDGLKLEEVVLDGVPHESVPLYLNAVDVMLLTSRTEASATVIREANLCNLPVVTCPAGDAALQLKDVNPGGVFSPEPKMLADAVRKILLSRTRSDGRKKAKDWGLGQTVSSVLEFYQLVLSGTQ